MLMKKKLISLVMVVSLMALTAVGCGSKGTAAAKDNASAETSDSYADKKVLRLGTECAYAPYNWTQESEDLPNGEKAVKISNGDGYAWGYDIAIAKMMADYLGWDLEIYKTEWTSIFMGLDAKDYDLVMSGMCYSKERDESMDFTHRYYERKINLTVSADGPFADITDLSQFDGKNPTITTQLGTNYPDYFEQIPSSEAATQYETSSEAFMAVQTGTADAVIMDSPTTISALSTMSGLKTLDVTFETPAEATNDVSIAVREGDTELQSLLNEALDANGYSEDATDQFDKLMDEMVKLQPTAN